MRIALLCPSRGRPARFRAMVASAVDLATDPDRVVIYLAADRDDPAFREYEVEFKTDGKVIPVVNEQKGRTGPALLNDLAYLADEEILFAVSDDILFRTQGWDEMLRKAFEAYPDRLLVAYTNDGRDRDKCTHFAVHRRWLDIAGGFTYPEFEHFCADTYVETIGKAIGRAVYLRELVTEHMHFRFGKSEQDETYASKRRSGMSLRDKARLKILLPRIDEIASRMRAAMQPG